MNITLDQVLTFLGGGLVVFILEQIINYIRRERHVIGFIADSRVIAEKSDKDLKIEYKGLEIERLISHKVILKNIGNKCLKEVPFYLQGSGGGFFFAELAAKPGIHTKTIEGEPCFAFSVDLLNPGDEVTVTLTILDAADVKLTVDARAEHVRVKDISNARTVSQMLDVMAEGSTGLTWTSIKLLRLLSKN